MRNRNVLLSLFVMITCDNIYAAEKHNATIGIGYGIGVSFGVLGVKLDYALYENTFVTMGVGEVPSIGIQYFFRGRNDSWRPTIYLGYGYVSNINALNKNNKKEVIEKLSGSTVGIGQVFQFGRGRNHAVVVDILIPLSDGGKSEKMAELEVQGYKNYGNAFDEILNHINFGYRFIYKFN